MMSPRFQTLSRILCPGLTEVQYQELFALGDEHWIDCFILHALSCGMRRRRQRVAR
jgi:hypothetical protein